MALLNTGDWISLMCKSELFNKHKSLIKSPGNTHQLVKNIFDKNLKLPSTLGANWKPKPKPNQLPPNVDLFQLLQMFFIRGAWEGQFRQAFHLRNCMAFKSHPFFNYPNPEPSLMSQKWFPQKKPIIMPWVLPKHWETRGFSELMKGNPLLK